MDDNNNIIIVALIFAAAYVISAILFSLHVSSEGMWVGANIHPFVYLHIPLFAIVAFVVGIVGKNYLPESEISPHAIENSAYWFFEVLGKAFDFEGKSNRPVFWIYALWSTLISIGLEIISYYSLYFQFYENSLLNYSTIFGLVALIPGLAVGARRLHDTGRSGWLQLLILTIVGIIPLIIWWAQESKLSLKEKTVNLINPENLSLELEKLSKLFKNGDITEAEYKKAKSRLLDG